MNPAKVDRARLAQLTDLPNVGPALARRLVAIGVDTPRRLVGEDPVALYERVCASTGVREDPCVLDVFISVTRFMDGAPPQPWWAYTAERKRMRRSGANRLTAVGAAE
jgi:hypothetical protein